MRKLILISVLAICFAGCTTTKVTETPPGSGNFQTNSAVDPKFTSTLETIGAINEASKPVNPFSGLVSIGLATAAAIATWVAKRKNDQNAQTSQLLKVVVQGVEQADNAEVKSTIQNHAVNIGVEGKLNDTVSKINKGVL